MKTRKLVLSAMCLSLALVLPFLTGQIEQFGNMLCPMHLPVLLCGFLCGWPWGLVVGLLSPFLRSLLFQMPVLYPMAVGMMFELAVYGAVCGLLYEKLPRKKINVYITLITAMVCGRIVWGIARFAMLGLFDTQFSFKMFLSGAVLTAWPGIVLQILLVPALVFAVEKLNTAKGLNR